MRIRLLAGFILQLAGISIAVFQNNPIVVLVLIYAGFVVLNLNKIRNLFIANSGKSSDPESTQYIVQCKGESGWFDLVLQKHPRAHALQFPVYNRAKEQLDTIMKTREPVETDRLRIVKRVTLEEVV